MEVEIRSNGGGGSAAEGPLLASQPIARRRAEGKPELRSSGEGRVRVCFPFVGDGLGGSHISVALLIEGLEDSRFEPVVVLHEEGPLAAFFRAKGVDFRLFPLPAYAGARPSLASVALAMALSALRLYRFLKSNRIAVVHANDLRMNLTWSFAARLAGPVFVWHQRTLFSPSAVWRLLGWLADGVLCISNAVKESTPALRHTPVEVAFNPFRPSAAPARDRARAALLAELRLPERVRLVGYVGRYNRQKRPELFLEVAARLAQGSSGPFAFLLFGRPGAGPEPIPEAALRRMAERLGIAERVHFMGFRQPFDAPLAGLDLLIVPAVRDGFSRVLIEAMLVGTPVVASRSGGHVDAVAHERTGLLAAPDDVDDFVACARRLLDDEAVRRRLVEEAERAARETYSVERHVREVAAFYERLLCCRKC